MAQIDELLVKLKADIKNFEANMKKASKQSSKTTAGIRKGFDKIKGPLDSAKGAVFSFKGALAAAGVVAGFNFARSTLEAADSLAKLSSNIGINAGLLQELQFAASQTGVSQNDLNSSMLRFNRRLSEAANGNAGFKKSYDELGISIKDNNGNLRSSEAVLFDVADAVAKMGSEADQSRILFNLFGDSGFRLVNLFKNGSPALRQFQQRARELGIVIGSDVLQAAEGATDKLDIMDKAVRAKLTTSLVKLIPAINAAADAVVLFADLAAKGFEKFDQLGKFVGESTAKLVNWVTGVKEVPPEIEAMVVKVDKSTESIEKNNKAIDEANKAMKEHAQFRQEVQKIVAESNKTDDTGARLREEIALLQKAKDQRLDIEGNLNEALQEKRDELFEFDQEKREQEIQALIEHNALLAELDSAKFNSQIANNEKKIRAIMAQEQMSNDFILKEELRLQKARRAFLDQQLNAHSSFFGSLMTLSKGSNKEVFEAAKGAAIAAAVIQGIVATQRAFANPPGPPFSIPIAAAAAAQAAVNVSRIKSTNFQTGVDEVPGIGRGDKVPAMLEPKERILNVDQNKTFTSFMQNLMSGFDGAGGGGGGGSMRIEVAFTGDAAEMLEARLIERNRIGIDAGLV